jgi:hypothetical protein
MPEVEEFLPAYELVPEWDGSIMFDYRFKLELHDSDECIWPSTLSFSFEAGAKFIAVMKTLKTLLFRFYYYRTMILKFF